MSPIRDSRDGRPSLRSVGPAGATTGRAHRPGHPPVGMSADMPADMAALMRRAVPGFVDRITTQIQGEVLPYAGPRSGRRRRLIEQAVGSASMLYVAQMGGGTGATPRAAERVDDLFRRMGYGEAIEGNNLQAMLSAYDIATRDAWTELRRGALDLGLSAQLLGTCGDSLFAFMSRLTDRVREGYAAGSAAAERDLSRGRRELLDALLRGAPTDEITSLAAAIAWMPPAQVVVCAAELTEAHALPAQLPNDSQLLARIERPVAVLVLDAIDAPDGLDEARSWFTHGRLAYSWPVPLAEVPDALRWARRALTLADLGVLEVGPTINCDEHLAALWLHSEPVMRSRLAHRCLRPLSEETPHARKVLAETLLAWTETHASAPVLARRLGVHPQTVRYRMRRLKVLFGDQLEDAEELRNISLALATSLPLWRNGHATDDLRKDAPASALTHDVIDVDPHRAAMANPGPVAGPPRSLSS